MLKKIKLLRTVSIVLTSISAADTAEFTLVDKKAGIKPAPLILFPDAPPFTRKAAIDLADYIEKTCGTRPEWIDGPPRQFPDRAIWVGYQPALDSLFPNIDFDFQHPEEIVIAASEKHLVIAGRDRWDPNHLIAQINGKRIEGIQQEYGTVNAIYTFLHDRLGVRWLWPGDLGEDIIPQESIHFATFTYRYHPSLRFRAGLFSYSRLAPRGSYGRSQKWTRRQRLQLGSLEMEGGHGFRDWWERFHETHPEYFALQPDGTRSGFPQPKYAKLCQSNPEVPKQWLADVEKALKQNPNQRVFNASPNDGWASGHCVCEHCRAWDHPDGELRSFHWKGTRQELPALSDRHVRFANTCARLLKQRYPDRDYYVMMLAYGHSRPAPIREVPAENVIVASVANFLNRDGLIDRGSTRGSTHKEQYIAWSKVAKHMMWRPNVGDPAGWPQGQPDVALIQAIEDFKLIGEKAMGIFVDMVWEHWATHGPQYYLMAHLLWDPSQDGQAILQNYYQRAFGPAATELEAYWNLMEETRSIFWASERAYPDVYDKAFFDRAYALLDQASRKVTDEPERFGARIDFVRIGLDHTRHMIDIRAGMTRYWNGDKREQANVLATWEKIEQLCKDHPYAINWGPIRPQTPRMAGLHPDYPPRKRAPVVKRIKSSEQR